MPPPLQLSSPHPHGDPSTPLSTLPSGTRFPRNLLLPEIILLEGRSWAAREEKPGGNQKTFVLALTGSLRVHLGFIKEGC